MAAAGREDDVGGRAAQALAHAGERARLQAAVEEPDVVAARLVEREVARGGEAAGGRGQRAHPLVAPRRERRR